MIAYKGFAPDFTASFGSGKKQYHVGDVLEEDSSKTARTGMHCAEYVLDCLYKNAHRPGTEYKTDRIGGMYVYGELPGARLEA